MKTYLTIFFLVSAIVSTYLVINFKDLSSLNSKQDVKSELNYDTIATSLNNLNFVDYDNKKIELLLSGVDVVVIHHWASWCSPCINEVPEIIEYSKTLVKTSNIRLLTVSLDEKKEDIHKFLLSFPEFNKNPIVRIWDKNKELAKLLNIEKLPSTIVMDKVKSNIRVYDGVVDWKNLKL